MEPFVPSNNNLYILVGVDHVSKSVDTQAFPINDVKAVINFLKKNIFIIFGTPGTTINDKGSHFCNKAFETILAKYEVKHKATIAYHPQTSGQVEVSIQETKGIMEKVVSL